MCPARAELHGCMGGTEIRTASSPAPWDHMCTCSQAEEKVLGTVTWAGTQAHTVWDSWAHGHGLSREMAESNVTNKCWRQLQPVDRHLPMRRKRKKKMSSPAVSESR